MKQKAIMLFIAILAASTLVGITLAQPTVTPPVVQPGDILTITDYTISDVMVTIEISNTRAQIDTFNITSDHTGVISYQYMVPSDAASDVYTVTITVEGEMTETSFIVSKMDQQQIVSTIRNLVSNSRKQAETVLIQARRQGNVPAQAVALYREGVNHLENAKTAIENQNYSVAQGELREAMNRFRQVIEYNFGETIEPPIDPSEKGERVEEKLDQLRIQYEKINATVERLGKYGINVDVLKADLEQLKAKIDEAEALLDEGDVNTADRIATETQRLVAQRLASLKEKQAGITSRLAERYQASLENRIAVYTDTFQRLEAVIPVKASTILQELQQLQLKLIYSENTLNMGNVNEALREMRETENRLKHISEMVNGQTTNRLLSKIDELSSNRDSLTNSQIQTEIEQLKETLKQYLGSRGPHIGASNALTP